MKKLSFASFCLLIFTSAICQQLSATDSLQIVGVINDWNVSWENKDFRQGTRGYSNDARFTNAFGDKCMGRDAIQTLLKEVFQLKYVMAGHSETTAHQFQKVKADLVIVHTAVIRKGQQMPDGTEIANRQTAHMRVFEKKQGNWQIIAHLISDARDKQSTKH